MILKIKSENPHLLDILNKNPNSNLGLYFSSLKNGTVVGNCVSQYEYEIVFQDGNDLDDSEYSFNPDKSNMIDFMSYASPRAILNIMTELFNDNLKEKSVVDNKRLNWLDKTISQIDTTEYKTVVEIDNLYIDSTWANSEGNFIFNKYYPSYIKLFEHKQGYLYRLHIECDGVNKTLNMLTFISLMLSLRNRGYFPVDDKIVEKYLRIVSNVGDIPYFVAYLIKLILLDNENLFNKYKHKLEEMCKDLTLQYGNTHVNRINYITSKILEDNDCNILDLGCGELLYAKKLANKITGDYHCVDTDEECELLVNKFNNHSSKKITFTTDYKNIKGVSNLTLLCTEVIEHIGITEAFEIINNIIENNDVNRIIISTPNKDFNVNYQMDGEMRRDDHIVELTKYEFQDAVFSDINMFGKYFMDGIGDTYKDIQPTSVVTIQKIN